MSNVQDIVLPINLVSDGQRLLGSNVKVALLAQPGSGYPAS